MQGKNKSITFNAFLSMFNSVLTMSFALLTYPYASRVLQVENLGKVNYSNSIVSYFVLLAALGFNTYAVREGSRVRNNQTKLNTFVQQIFTLNSITSIVSLILLVITLVVTDSLHPYTLLILIQSLAIVNSWIGVSWVNVIVEDYIFITIRSIVVQLISILSLFLFVKTKEDYFVYATINVLANSLVAIINFIHSKKYCHIAFTSKTEAKKHFPPVFVFFSNSLAVSIYLNSDTTMIGWILGDYQVGLYSVAVKIYSTIKTIIAALYNVAVARMSLYSTDENKDRFKKLLNQIINTVILVSIPTTMGLFILSENIIVALSGDSYLPAATTLKILSFAFLFAILGGVFAYCIAIPLKKEKYVLTATVISAIENIALNLLLIPVMGIEGAALTTLLAEITVFIVLLFNLRSFLYLVDLKCIVGNIVRCLIGASLFIPLRIVTNYLKMGLYLDICVYFILAVLTYSFTEAVLKNKIFYEFVRGLKKKELV